MATPPFLLVAVGLWCAAGAPPKAAGERQSVLIMPIGPLGGVSKDLAQQVTNVLVSEAGKLADFRILSFRELEGALTQEQMKQASGCDSTSCAAELAGALDTDQIVVGNLGRVGQSYLLTLSRIVARDAATAGRSTTKFPSNREEALIDGMGAVVAELFGVDAPAPAAVSKPAPKKAEPTVLKGPPRAGQVMASDNGTQAYVWIPPGSVTLGCPDKDDNCTDEDAPEHPGRFSGFWLNKSEVTVDSFQQCVAAGVCRDGLKTRDNQAQGCNLAHGRASHPMNCVTYFEAQKYCEWEGGRIPNSDEWEFAARAGKAVKYPWGNAPPTGKSANFCDRQCVQARAVKKSGKASKKAEKAIAQDDGYIMTAPVGLYAQGTNTWGLQDMAGNLAEWSYTELDVKKGPSMLSAVSPKLLGLIPGSGKNDRELLGGAWSSKSINVAVYSRSRSAPGDWDHEVGFRCLKQTPRYEGK